LTNLLIYETLTPDLRRFYMSKNIGYARVSTDDQDLDLQVRELKASGCKKVLTDRVSGLKGDRPGLDVCLKTLKKGDTLVVWRLDRLGRSMQHLVNVVAELKAKGVGFKSLRDGAIDTTTASGELVFNIFAALAQFERELIRERTMAGLSAARARGRLGGRKPVSPDDPKVRAAKKLHADKSMSILDICKTVGISRATLYRYRAL
jgi:DNA invertase Pin-like site-specific DNA recombinase